MRPAITCGMLVLAGFLAFAAPAQAARFTLTSADIFRVTFTTNPANFGNKVPDLIQLIFFNWFSTPLNGFTARLYDGDTLLGTYSKGPDPALGAHPMFKSLTNPDTFRNPTPVDFTSILNGTIKGRLDFQITSGIFAFDFLDTWPILWRSTFNPAGASGLANWATFSAQVVPAATVPEHSSLLFFGFGIAALAARLYRRS
jgi:hypothetical protein